MRPLKLSDCLRKVSVNSSLILTYYFHYSFLFVVYCSGSVLSADFFNVYFRIERYNRRGRKSLLKT